MHKVVGVVFNENNNIYYFEPGDLKLSKGQKVIVETERGLQYGSIKIGPYQEKDENLMLPLKKVVRISNQEDDLQHKKNVKEEQKALKSIIELAKQMNLNMHFINASFTHNRSQLLFKFVADERVDFRELAKKLAQVYKTRIELRQIGVRDKAKEVGGIGPCGRFLCCNSFLREFTSVSINMAKNQYLALNPTKINGLCGRLLCCLNYEDETYTELKKGMPEIGYVVKTPQGNGKVIAINLFKKTYQVELSDNEIIEVLAK